MIPVVGAIPLPLLGGYDPDQSSAEPDITIINNMPDTIDVRITEEQIPFRNHADYGPEFVADWNSYIGQEPMKRQLRVYMDAAKELWEPLPHILLASGLPGAGKTTLARLIAKEMNAHLTMLVPPFTSQTLYDALLSMPEYGILFIDEIHKLGDSGPRAAENLLTAMEENWLHLDSGSHELPSWTLIGATTDKDKLPEAIIDRFSKAPYFQKYSLSELVRITHNFTKFYNEKLLPETLVAIAKACRGTPRVARHMVETARAMQVSSGYMVGGKELLDFMEVTPDGLTRQHQAYVMAMFQFFGREADDGTWEYIAGEASMMSLLRENKQGISRLERYLIERGLVDRTPRGRRLTARGQVRAREWKARNGALNAE